MPQFESNVVEIMFWVLCGVVAIAVAVVAFLLGRWAGRASVGNAVAVREKELFTAQKGFRQLYESEIAQLKTRVGQLDEELTLAKAKVEDYRKKAAGYGGLFNSHKGRADAMYALLLENEALEEALTHRNRKLADERDEHLRETMRHGQYRRVLMNHILADDRVKRYVNDVLADEKRLPAPESNGDTTRQLPEK